MKDTDKVTLTVGQIKKLIKESKSDFDESYDDRMSEFNDEEKIIINSLDKISYQLNKVLLTSRFGSQKFQNSIKTALNSIDDAKQSYMI